jgi:hypothetical protein
LACFRTPPADWRAGFAAHEVRVPGGVGFTVDAVAGDTAFGEYLSESGNGVGTVDLITGGLRRVTTFPAGTAGIGAMAADALWLVWVQLDSQTDLSGWSIHAWNRSTGAATVLADSRLPGGGHVAGQQPIPVLRNGFAAWAQPAPNRTGEAGAELRVVDLNTGSAVTAARGRLSSPVYAGQYLVWGTVTTAGYRLQVVDADTLRPAALPGQPPHPVSIGYLAGSEQYLAWSDAEDTGLTVWRIGSSNVDHFTARDGRHFFQFLALAGQFLVWFAAASSSVLDLSTGAGFDVPGTVTGSPDWIVTATPDATGTAPSLVSRLPTRNAPRIPGCHG